jgi:hypothetical protein
MIKSEFFKEGSYHIDIRNPNDFAREGEISQQKPLIELCLPISELKQIFDGICEEGNDIKLSYPAKDCYFKLEIPDKSDAFEAIL